METKEEKNLQSFADLGVTTPLLKAIEELGFEEPMPIQRLVIPHLNKEEGDVVGLAQTGTGKTAAFGLPVLQRIDTTIERPQALIIAPTRELCLQIAGDLADFSKYIDKLRILPVYGGSSIESQIRSLHKGVQVIVATPGRLIDLIKRGEVKLENVNTVILDEADEMLNMGFLEDIEEILSHVPQERKMLMFSATMPKEIEGIARKFMQNPVEFVAGNKNEGAKNVKHIYYMVKAHDKYLALKRIADNAPDIYGLIFCRTRRETQEIADKLIADGYNADCLHGDLSQAQRDLAMKKFRDHVTQLLVATDVAARGLDVDDLTHVINYGLPDDVAVYTHRSGRTGRANKTGVSIAIIHSREKGRLRQIEKKIGKEFEYKKVPTPEHIIEKQIYHLADRIERVAVDDGQIEKFLPGVRKKLEWLSEEDLLKRVLSLEFNRLLAYYRDMPDIDLNEARNKKERKKTGGMEQGMIKLVINAGKSQGLFPGTLMELINRNIEGKKPDIGHIDLKNDYAFFDVENDEAKKVISSLNGINFFGTRLKLEIATDRDYEASGRNRLEKKRRKAAQKKSVAESTKKVAGKKGKKQKKGYIGTPASEVRGKRPNYNGNYDIFMKK